MFPVDTYSCIGRTRNIRMIPSPSPVVASGAGGHSIPNPPCHPRCQGAQGGKPRIWTVYVSGILVSPPQLGGHLLLKGIALDCFLPESASPKRHAPPTPRAPWGAGAAGSSRRRCAGCPPVPHLPPQIAPYRCCVLLAGGFLLSKLLGAGQGRLELSFAPGLGSSSPALLPSCQTPRA